MNPETTADIRAVITATDAGASATLAGFGASVGTLGAAAGKVGADMTKYLTLPILGVTAASAKLALNFQQQMELIRTQAGASQQEVDNMSKSVLNLAQVSEFGPQKLSEALFHIESTGLRGAAAMNVLKTASEGASLGQADLTDTTNTLLGIMNSHILGVKNATDAMSVLNSIIGAGNVTMTDLNAAMGTGIAATASTFGVSLQSVGAALAQMTAEGIPATKAAMGLNMAMVLMSAPTANAAKILEGIGIGANDAQASTASMTDALAKAHITTNALADDLKQPNGLSVAVQDLKTHMQDAGLSADAADAVISRAFGGGRTGKAILELGANLQGVNDKYAAIIKNSGNFQSSVDAQSQTINAKLRTAWAGLQADLIKFGDAILPVLAKGLTDLTNVISGVTKWYESLTPAQKSFLDDALLVVAVMGPMLVAFSKVVKIAGDIHDAFQAVGSVITGIPGMISAIGSKASDMASTTGNVLDTVKGKVNDVAGAIGNGISAGANWIKNAALVGAAWIKNLALMIVASARAAISMAVDAGRAAIAWIVAAHNSEQGLVGSLIVASAKGAWFVIQTTAQAIASSVIWVKNAIITAAAWTASFIAMAAKGIWHVAATTPSAIASAGIWVFNAGVTAAAWTASFVASVVKGAWFVVETSAQALLAAAIWVAKAIETTVAWVASALAKEAAGVVFVAANAVQAAAASGAWVSAASISQVAWVGMFGAVVAAAGIAAFAIIDAANKAKAEWDRTNTAIQADSASETAGLQQLQSLAKSGTPEQQARAKQALTGLANQHAAGTSFAPGGLSLVGEAGPELVDLPRGSKVFPNSKTNEMLKSSGNPSSINITVQAGAFMGNPQDARKYADMILQAMQDLATSKGMSFDQLWRHHGVRAI